MVNRKFGFSVSRIQEAKKVSDGGSLGSAVQNIFNWKLLNIRPSFFSVKEGTNKINILPYEIKTMNHPQTRSGNLKIGNPDCQDFYYPLKIHRYFGPLKAHVVCPAQFGQPCPICEQGNQLYDQGDKEGAKIYWPQKRVFYNVEDTSEPGKIKIFENSESLFQKELMDEAAQGSEEGVINFVDCDNGKTVRFRAAKVQKGDFNYFEFKSFAFEDRAPISDELLAQSISFDELIVLYSYDDIRKIMIGELPSEKSDTVVQQAAAPAQPTQTIAPPAPQPVTQTATVDVASLAAQAAAPVVPSTPQPVVQQLVQQAPIPQPVAQPVAPTVAQPVVQQPVAPAAAPATGGLTCPHGYVCGKDTDSKPECDSCPIWDKCIEMS